MKISIYSAIISAILLSMVGVGYITYDFTDTKGGEEDIQPISYYETRWFSHQFNNVSGMSIANETFYNGSCNILLDITVRFDTEFGDFTLFVDDEEVLYITRNKTNIEVAGTNLTITIHANGGDEYPDNAMADYYVVKMVSKCS
jgi:hypothetical protein